MESSKVAPSAIVLELLNLDNYEHWSRRVETYLLAEGLWKVVEPTADPDPKPEDDKFDAWSRQNAKALHVIHISCGSVIFSLISDFSETKSAKKAWDMLAKKFKLDNFVPKGHENNGANVDLQEPYAAFFKKITNQDVDWDYVMEFLDLYPEAVKERDPITGYTSLHFAVRSRKAKVVEKMVQLMEKKDMEIKDFYGQTAFYYAVWMQSAKKKIVECLVGRDKALVSTYINQPPYENVLPVLVAASSSNWEIADYLYHLTPEEALKPEAGPNGADIITTCILQKKFDIAWDLIQRYPNLAITQDFSENYPLYLLAGMRSAFLSGTPLTFWQRWIYNCIRIHDDFTSHHVKTPEIDEGSQMNVTESGIRIHGDFTSYHVKTPEIDEGSQMNVTESVSMPQLDLPHYASMDISSWNYRLPTCHPEIIETVSMPQLDLQDYASAEKVSMPQLDVQDYASAEKGPFYFSPQASKSQVPDSVVTSMPQLDLQDYASVETVSMPQLNLQDYASNETKIYVSAPLPEACPAHDLHDYSSINIFFRIPQLLPSHPGIIGSAIGRQVKLLFSNIFGPIRSFFREIFMALLKPLGIFDRIYEMKLVHVRVRRLLECMSKVTKPEFRQSHDSKVQKAIFRAIQDGHVEFVTILVMQNGYANALAICDKRGRNFFKFAVECRQEKVYNLIYECTDEQFMDRMGKTVDNLHNSLLHIVGSLSPFSQFNHIRDAALQMQRELQWLKEVENFVSPSLHEFVNLADNMTGRELFTKNHKELVKEGEKSMKETATSCTVVGALIVTIMFAAAFTVIGGNNQNTGLPMFLDDRLFMVFIVSDALSLFSSTTSVMIFLGILTSRYAEDDFLTSLPTKMMVGLLTLFFSIATMMVAFSTTLIIMLHDKYSWIVVPIIVFACVPITSFVWMQFPLLVEISVSTYGPGIFPKRRGHSRRNRLKMFYARMKGKVVRAFSLTSKNKV